VGSRPAQLERQMQHCGPVPATRIMQDQRETFSFQFVFLFMLAIGEKEISLTLHTPALCAQWRAIARGGGALAVPTATN
jgi:hypothetical protein